VPCSRERGTLGFNCKMLIEMGEEVGSAGLRELCAQHRGDHFKADVLIGSDGPRIAPGQPTIFLGARGTHLIDLFVDLREGAHHSGNWGGALANPAIILAQALATITDARGAIRVPEWLPALPQSVRDVLDGVRSRRRRRRTEDRPRLGRAGPDAGRARVSAGTVSRLSLSPPARRNGRSMPFPARRARIANCATWSAPTPKTLFRRCGGISTATVLRKWNYALAEAASSRRAASIRPIRG